MSHVAYMPLLHPNGILIPLNIIKHSICNSETAPNLHQNYANYPSFYAKTPPLTLPPPTLYSPNHIALPPITKTFQQRFILQNFLVSHTHTHTHTHTLSFFPSYIMSHRILSSPNVQNPKIRRENVNDDTWTTTILPLKVCVCVHVRV